MKLTLRVGASRSLWASSASALILMFVPAGSPAQAQGGLDDPRRALLRPFSEGDAQVEGCCVAGGVSLEGACVDEPAGAAAGRVRPEGRIHGGWAREAAWAGFASGGGVLLLALASSTTEESGLRLGLGGLSLLGSAIMGPVVAIGGESARGGQEIEGSELLRSIGWIVYAAGMLDGLVILALAVGEGSADQGPIILAGVLGGGALVAFGFDALISANEVDSMGNAGLGGPAPEGISFGVLPIVEPDGHIGALLGVSGGF